jgi:hypothetical protein
VQRHAPKVIAIFSVAGLCSAAVALLLGFVYLPSLFFLAGVILFGGMAAAYWLALSSGWVLAAPSRARYWEAAALVAIGYPAAELFGTIMSLFCEALLFAMPSAWHAVLKNYEPVPMIGLLAFWGSLAAAFAVNAAVMVITDRWDKRLLLYLSIAGTVTTVVAMAVYAPNYSATTGFAAEHRELVLFGILLPLGDVLFSVLAGYGLVRARPQARAAAAH